MLSENDPAYLSQFTQLVPIGRLGDAQEVAEVALYLASDAEPDYLLDLYCTDVKWRPGATRQTTSSGATYFLRVFLPISADSPIRSATTGWARSRVLHLKLYSRIV